MSAPGIERAPIRPELAKLYEEANALAHMASDYTTSELPTPIREGIKALHEAVGDLAYGEDSRPACAGCKTAKLADYASKPLTTFFQIDGFGDEHKGEAMIDPAGTGEGVMGGFTEELMSGPDVVRVLIRPNQSKAKVLALLDRIRKWVAADALDRCRESLRGCPCGQRTLQCPNERAAWNAAEALIGVVEAAAREEARKLADREIPF